MGHVMTTAKETRDFEERKTEREREREREMKREGKKRRKQIKKLLSLRPPQRMSRCDNYGKVVLC